MTLGLAHRAWLLLNHLVLLRNSWATDRKKGLQSRTLPVGPILCKGRRVKECYLFPELGTGQFVSFATTTTRDVIELEGKRKKSNNFEVSVLKWSSHNGFVYAMQCNAMQGLKTWSRGHSSVNCRMSCTLFEKLFLPPGGVNIYH